MEKNIIKESDVCDVIRTEIEKMHPIMEPRLDLDAFEDRRRPEMEILLYLYNNSIKSQIVFLDGNSFAKSSIDNGYLLEDFLSNDNLSNILNYFLEQYPLITDFSVEKNKISFDFKFDFGEILTSGISAYKITFSIQTREKDLYYKINDYLKYILSNYYDKLSHTELFKREYNRYLDCIKEEYINSMTKEDILLFLQDMEKDILKEILMNIDNDIFMEKINPYQREKMLIKKISNK